LQVEDLQEVFGEKGILFNNLRFVVSENAMESVDGLFANQLENIEPLKRRDLETVSCLAEESLESKSKI